ncbi:MAG TPA: hypothetical protein VFY25_16620, partial [Anaerolineales bacterium]|nr:hypothetical protein [Anaerolineales bacterium]
AAEPPAELVPLPTPTAAAADSARVEETPSEKNGVPAEESAQDQSQVQNVPSSPQQVPLPVPPTWQILLAIVAVLSAGVMLLMRWRAAERWRQK